MLTLVPAKVGCRGCYYEDEFACPAVDEDYNLMKDRPCTEFDQEMIFVEVEDESRDSE